MNRREYFAVELDALKPMRDDGLLDIAAGSITVTPRGRLLVRNIAMVFDQFLPEPKQRGRYSRVI